VCPAGVPVRRIAKSVDVARLSAFSDSRAHLESHAHATRCWGTRKAIAKSVDVVTDARIARSMFTAAPPMTDAWVTNHEDLPHLHPARTRRRDLNSTFYAAAHEPKFLWEIAEASDTGGLHGRRLGYRRGWSWRLGGEEPVEEGAVAGEGDA
jgi:hypothetical protein